MNDQDKLVIQCSAVWGDVRGMLNQDVELSDLAGYVYSQPFEGNYGGDVVFLSRCNRGCLGKIFLADISGHGSFLKDSAEKFQALLSKHINEVDSSRLLEDINNDSSLISSQGKFVTAVSATFNRKNKELIFAYAGHPNILYFDAQKNVWKELKAQKLDRGKNVPLGILPGTQYLEDTISVNSNDLFILFTDGLTEERNAHHELFGLSRLYDVCTKLDTKNLENFTMSVISTIRQFHGSEKFSDDITFMVFKVA